MFEETDESRKLKRKGPMAARIGKRGEFYSFPFFYYLENKEFKNSRQHSSIEENVYIYLMTNLLIIKYKLSVKNSEIDII